MNLIKQDLNVIIELTDILHYTLTNHPRLAKTVSIHEQKLINELSNVIESYREDLTKLSAV